MAKTIATVGQSKYTQRDLFTDIAVSTNTPVEMSGLSSNLATAEAWNEVKAKLDRLLKNPWQNKKEDNVDFCERLVKACSFGKPKFEHEEKKQIQRIVDYLCCNVKVGLYQPISDAYAESFYNNLYMFNRDPKIIPPSKHIVLAQKLMNDLQIIEPVLGELLRSDKNKESLHENGKAFMKSIDCHINECKDYLKRVSKLKAS